MPAARSAVDELVKCFTVTSATALDPPTLKRYDLMVRRLVLPVCAPVPALVTDVDPHALPSQWPVLHGRPASPLLSKLGHTVRMITLGGILNDALSVSCKEHGGSTNTASFNWKSTMFTCRPRTRTQQRAHACASRDLYCAWPAGTPRSSRRRR